MIVPAPSAGGDDPVDVRAAVVLVGDHGPEDEPRGEAEEKHRAGRDQRRPYPGACAHLLVADPELSAQRFRLLAAGEVGAGRGLASPRAHPHQQRGADQEGRGVDGECLAGSDAEDQRRRQGRADELADVVRHRHEGIRLLDLGLGDGLRDHRGRRGAEEGLRRSEQRLDHDDLPDRDVAGDDQHGEGPVEGEADQVGDDHQPVPRHPVGPDPAEQHERDERDRVRRQDEAEVDRIAGQVDHEQRQGDGDDPVAEHAGETGQPEQPEVAVSEDCEESGHRADCQHG